MRSRILSQVKTAEQELHEGNDWYLRLHAQEHFECVASRRVHKLED